MKINNEKVAKKDNRGEETNMEYEELEPRYEIVSRNC
jgi:hypothetical protein